MNTTHVSNTRRAAPFQRDEPDELTTTVSTDARVPQGIKYCDTRRSIVVPGILRNDNQPFHQFPRQNNSSDSENSPWPQEDIETLAQTLPKAPTETRTNTRVEPALKTRCSTNSSAANLGGTHPSARTTAGTWIKALTTREDRPKYRAGRRKSLARPTAGTMAKTRSKTMSKAMPKIHRDKQPSSPAKSSTTAMSILARINMSKAMAKIHRDTQSPSPPETSKTAMPISAPVKIPTPRLVPPSAMGEAPSLGISLTILENPFTGGLFSTRVIHQSRALTANAAPTATAAPWRGRRRQGDLRGHASCSKDRKTHLGVDHGRALRPANRGVLAVKSMQNQELCSSF
ncbi:hypothetical protein MAJ_07101, partial [Metarhizium majus ARSEF 297]